MCGGTIGGGATGCVQLGGGKGGAPNGGGGSLLMYGVPRVSVCCTVSAPPRGCQLGIWVLQTELCRAYGGLTSYLWGCP